jgi:hypothetical protein
LDWFNSNTMSTEEMETVEGWISVLKREFVVNSAKAMEKAASTDKSVMDYFYQKMYLVKPPNSEINDKYLFDEIWLGLPPEFQGHLDFRSLRLHSLDEIGHTSNDMDPSFREAWRNSQKKSWSEEKSLRHSELRPMKKGKTETPDDKKSISMKTAPTKSSTLKEQSKDDHSIPQPLPLEQWKKDKQGRTMTRKMSLL